MKPEDAPAGQPKVIEPEDKKDEVKEGVVTPDGEVQKAPAKSLEEQGIEAPPLNDKSVAA